MNAKHCTANLVENVQPTLWSQQRLYRIKKWDPGNHITLKQTSVFKWEDANPTNHKSG
uniref:Uncharacterized protein n=1 Tax=Arundo donax TaxID=35708 RepID=A0A0A9CCT3_ARUDO